MKEFKKEIIRKEYKTVYIANDGIEFTDAAECKKYEQSALGVLNSRYNEFVIKTISEEELTKMGNCDSVMEIVKISEYDDIDVLAQLYCLYHSYEKTSDYVDRIRNICKKAIKTGDLLLINRGYEYDNFWLIDTLTDYLNSVLKQCDPNSKIKIEDEDELVEE